MRLHGWISHSTNSPKWMMWVISSWLRWNRGLFCRKVSKILLNISDLWASFQHPSTRKQSEKFHWKLCRCYALGYPQGSGPVDPRDILKRDSMPKIWKWHPQYSQYAPPRKRWEPPDGLFKSSQLPWRCCIEPEGTKWPNWIETPSMLGFLVKWSRKCLKRSATSNRKTTTWDVFFSRPERQLFGNSSTNTVPHSPGFIWADLIPWLIGLTHRQKLAEWESSVVTAY